MIDIRFGLGVALFVFALWLKSKRKHRLPLPPGPPGDPIIGHLRYIPENSPADKFAEWSKKYGDVMLVKVFNTNIIILNTAEAATDLMDKRSWNYNDRPGFPLLKMMGWVPTITFNGYGEIFRRQRRLLQQSLSRTKVAQHQHIQIQEARRLAINLLEHPDDREGMLSRYSTSIIMRVAYGHEITSDDDPYLKIAEASHYALSHCGPAGGTPVDYFPILRHLPSWVPGTFYAHKAREFRPTVRNLHEYPFAQVQKQMSEGTAKPSFLSYHLERLHREGLETPEEFEEVKAAAAVMYCAGAETTWTSMSIFMLAMTVNPECQVRVHQELDALLGGSRLPELEDRDSLPYLECVMQESHRWLNSLPMGVPHRVMEDDVYKGMFIPKGSLIFANTRGISRNESVYHDPESFKPSRYLPKSEGGHGEPFPSAQFGFGRRICPGRYLADVSGWLAVATILTLFDIKKAVGVDGKEITPEIALHSGFTSHPKPYQCVVKLRNESAKKLADQIKVELMG